MNFLDKAVSGLRWSFLIQFGLQSINFIVSVILARILMPADFGILGMIAIFIAIGRVLVDGGLSASLMRTDNPDQSDYSTVYFLNLFGSGVLYLIMFFSAGVIADFFDHPELKAITRVLCLTFILSAFSTVQSTKLNKNLQFKTQFILSMPSLLVSSAVGIWLAFKGYGVWSLVWKEIVFATLATIQLWFYSKWAPSPIFSLEKLKVHLKFGYKLTLTGIINVFFENVYKLIIGKYFTAAQLGYYMRAKSIEELPTSSLVSAFNRVTFPLLSQIMNDEVSLKSVHRKLLLQILFWTTPILIIAGVLATPLIRALLTEKWLSTVPFLQILVIVGILYPISIHNLNIFYVKGRSDLVLKLSIIQNILTLIGALSAIWIGIHGLLWSMVIVSLIMTILSVYYCEQLIHSSWFERLWDLSKVFLIGIFAGAIGFVFDRFLLIDEKDILRLIFSTVSSFVTYLIVSYMTKSEALIDVIMVLRSRLFGKTILR